MGSGLTLVIIGARFGFAMVSVKVRGPSLPVLLVAVTAKELDAAVGGVPVNAPTEESDAQLGSPVAPQVIGAVPVAVN